MAAGGARGGAELTCSPRLLRKPASHTAAGLTPDMCWISAGYLVAACSKAESAGCKQPASGTRQPFPRGRPASASSGRVGREVPNRGRPPANGRRMCHECATHVPRTCHERATHVPRTCHAQGLKNPHEIAMCHAMPPNVPRTCHAITKCATHVPRMCHVCATVRSVHGWRPRPLAGGSHAAAGLSGRRARLSPCAS